jgi:hypothetical protein
MTSAVVPSTAARNADKVGALCTRPLTSRNSLHDTLVDAVDTVNEQGRRAHPVD